MMTIFGTSLHSDQCWIATGTPYYYEDAPELTVDDMFISVRRWNSKRVMRDRRHDLAEKARIKRTARKVGS